MSEQVQVLLRSCRGNIELANLFVTSFALLNFLQIPIGRIVIRSHFFDGRQQPLQCAIRAHPLVKQEQPGIIASPWTAEARKNDRVKLQALRLVDGHHLKPIFRLRVGLCVELVHALAENRQGHNRLVQSQGGRNSQKRPEAIPAH